MKITTQRKRKIIKRIEKLFHEWKLLKKNKVYKTKRSEKIIKNENKFKRKLTELFDVTLNDVLDLIHKAQSKKLEIFSIRKKTEKQPIELKLLGNMFRKSRRALNNTKNQR